MCAAGERPARRRPSRRGAEPPTAGSSVIPALTGIRAVALVAVLAYHLREPLLLLFRPAVFIDPLLVFAFLALDVFFILSGFIISYNYAERLAGLTWRAYHDYILARFARIYPTHVFALLLMTVLVVLLVPHSIPNNLLAFGDRTVPAFLGSLLMLQGLPGVGMWNGPAWSITCEFAAYLLFPFVAGVLARQRLASAVVLAVLFAVVLVGAITVVKSMVVFPVFTFFWVRIATEFPLGCLMWVVWRHTSWRRHAGDATTVVAVIAVVAVVTLWANSSLAWIAVPCLAVVVFGVASSGGPVRAILASRPVEWLGRTSYSVYLVHVPVLLVMYEVMPYQDLPEASRWLRATVLAAYFVAPVLVGAATFHFVEEPARRRLRGRRVHAARPTALGTTVVGSVDGVSSHRSTVP